MVKNKSGFVLLETIIVICILCVGILSIYRTYANLIQRINSTDLNNNAENSFKAEYIAPFVVDNYTLEDGAVYMEIDLTEADNVWVKTCWEDILCGDYTLDLNDQKVKEEIEAFRTLDISKIYYTKRTILDLTDYVSPDTNESILLTLDGSTINYLRKVKNKVPLTSSDGYNLIVKTKKGTFGYYQKGRI